MEIDLRHVGVVAENVTRLADFYERVIGLEPITTPSAQDSRMVPFRWLRLGHHQLHVVQRDPKFAAALRVRLNPSTRPHFAVRIDDMSGLKARLEAAKVTWVDWSNIGISGLNQIFVRDPDGNLVEFEEF